MDTPGILIKGAMLNAGQNGRQRLQKSRRGFTPLILEIELQMKTTAILTDIRTVCIEIQQGR
jgi:hypothetical protein